MAVTSELVCHKPIAMNRKSATCNQVAGRTLAGSL